MKFIEKYKLKLSPSASIEIMRIIINHAYNQLRLGLLISLSGATIILVFLYHTSDHIFLFSWYALFLIVTLIRMFSIRAYRLQKFPDDNFDFWNKAYIIGAMFGGLCWGLTSILFYQTTNNTEQILSILALALVTTWSVTILSNILSAVVVFIIAVATPFIIQCVLFPESSSIHFIGIFFVFICYLLIHSVKTHNMVINSYILQNENELLSKNIASSENQYSHLTTHDMLTKVNNRSFFYKKTSEIIQNSKRNKKLLGLLYIDFDDFNEINNIFGRHMGDQLLIIIAEELQKIIMDKSLIFRVGDDEFTVLLEGIDDNESIEKISIEISQAITKPIKIADNIVTISASIGVSIYPHNGKDSETLIKAANDAMQHIKKHGKNNIFFSTNSSVD